MPGARRRFDPSDMRREQVRASGRVRAASEKVRNLSRMLESANVELTDSISAAARVNIPLTTLADITGYSAGRIWQIVNDWHPASVAQEKGKGQA